MSHCLPHAHQCHGRCAVSQWQSSAVLQVLKTYGHKFQHNSPLDYGWGQVHLRSKAKTGGGSRCRDCQVGPFFETQCILAVNCHMCDNDVGPAWSCKITWYCRMWHDTTLTSHQGMSWCGINCLLCCATFHTLCDFGCRRSWSKD